MPSRAEDTANERPPGRVGAPSVRREPVAGHGPASGSDAVAPARALESPGPADEAKQHERIGFIGKRLGRFLITAELGRGGMATVYRARDPQVGRDVAVKVMHGFFAGRAEIEARFRREANAVAAIKHPSILALYDFAPPAGEEPGYIVSELIEGPGLRQVVEDRGGRLMPEVAGLITVRLAEALGAAHAAGIVHRDVKPDNVLIDRSGGGARVVLTDFGVAHVSGMDTMTATGAVLGSPAYMSPEQARGDDVGPASDVFSLGVLMYQLCTGHLPFAGRDPLTVITGILRGEYQRPSRLESRLGPDWENVITRCLSREPARRFPDGAAVAKALRELLAPAGLVDEQVALRRYLADPPAFEGELAPVIARLATAAAEKARRSRQTPRALAEVGRALAYAPDDPTAQGLLRRVGGNGGPRWLGSGLAGVAAIVLVVAFAVTRPARLAPTPFDAPRTAAAAASASTASAINLPQGRPVSPAALSPAGAVVAAAAPPAPAASTTGAVVATAPASRKERAAGMRTSPARNTRVRPINRVARSQETAAGSVDEGHAGTTATEESPPLAAPPAMAEVQTASVVLRASHGFCEPSLDAHPPSLRASYNGLEPGPHDIYCTLPQKGGKVHVARYDLRPGTRPSLTIVPGPDGRPTLSRPE